MANLASKATIKKMKNMFNGDLPIVNANVIVGTKKVQIEEGKFKIEYIREVISVEVLTLNFNTNGMRVRYIANLWGSKEIKVEEISIVPFIKQFNINKKDRK